jgi:hypothetical protein
MVFVEGVAKGRTFGAGDDTISFPVRMAPLVIFIGREP